MRAILKKLSIAACISAGAVSSSSPATAQTIKSNLLGMSISQNGSETVLCRDSNAVMTYFSGTLAEGKAYLHWNVAGQTSDGTYIIYRSVDAKNYQILGCKNGIGVPVKQDIAYYFTDENPAPGTNYYMVFHMGDNKTFLASGPISLETKNDQLMSRVDKNRNKQ